MHQTSTSKASPAAPTPRPGQRPAPAVGGPRGRKRLLLLAARVYTAVLMHSPLSESDLRVPAPDGRYGPSDGEATTLLLLGDSLAQSVGVRQREQTVGAQLSRALTQATQLPIDLRVVARGRALTSALPRQLERAAGLRPGLALIVIGGNDALLPVSVNRAARRFDHAVSQLCGAGWQVVAVPCPDPRNGPGFRVPVGRVASPRARRLARRQADSVRRHGALLAPSSVAEFCRRPAELLSPDGVHPSPTGYAEHAARLLPILLTAMRRRDEATE